MCYGQTGAGKTFTMTGSTESYQNRGIIPRAISQLFKQLDNRSDDATVVRLHNFDGQKKLDRKKLMAQH